MATTTSKNDNAPTNPSEEEVVQDIGDENSLECSQAKRPKKMTSKMWLQMTKLEDGGAQRNQCKKLFKGDSNKALCVGDSRDSRTCNTESDAFEDFGEFLITKAESQPKKTELDIFLEEPNEDFNVEIDMLDFWKSNVARFPKLASMARDILAIPISTMASESTFSIEKKVINPWRSSLSRKTIETLVCLEDWHRAKDFTWGILEESLLDDVASSSDDEVSPNTVVEDVF